ncbi:hypothetical protein JHK86_028269 [Glycine max]|nr:hypothetical protein JHK86_028269 [Glycine max]
MNPKPVEAVPAWSNQIIFDASKEAEEGIAYQWSYMAENECKCNDLVSKSAKKLIRESKMYLMFLSWNCYTRNASDSLSPGVSGAFRPGVLTTLMGVSGAGKTTLMDVLAGRKTGRYI